MVRRQALWNAAVVAYARCFTTGVRIRLDASAINRLPEQAKANHQYFLDLRNKFIAHSVSPFEESVVMAMVSPLPNVALLGIGCVLVRPAQETPITRAFRALAAAVLEHVQQAATLKQEEVHAELATLNEKQLLTLSDMGIELPKKPCEVRKVRPRSGGRK